MSDIAAAAKVSPPLSEDPLNRVFQAVRDAWYANRAIVPVVGAGLSADAGIPIIRSVVRYFGKFRQFLHHRAYLPPIAAMSRSGPISPYAGGDPIERLRKYYLWQPWQYVAHFGWPDRFQLNQDLQHQMDSIRSADDTDRLTVANEVCNGLNAILERLNPGGYWHYKTLLVSLVGLEKASQVFPELSTERLNSAHKPLIDDKQSDDVIARLKTDDFNNSVPFNLLGDWKRLIQYFTNYHGDYADALFSRLCAGRGPQQGHSYLAFLVKLLGIKTILTFNFDDLIEQSLRTQNVHPRVFAMEEGRGLPHGTLVRDTVSVIKLHGSNHALLVDERLDRPLQPDYKHRFDDLVATDPLLLVVGCSGEDRRLRDLVEHVLQSPNTRSRTDPSVRVAWLHFEATPPSFLAKYAMSAISAQANSPAATLMHCYSSLTNRHPASTKPYLAHTERPIPCGKVTALPDPKRRGPSRDQLIELYSGKFIIAVISTWDHKREIGVIGQDPSKYPAQSASKTLLDAAAYWLEKGYHTIWVDLESVHTLAGVVGSILDQCRRYDISLAASVLPSGEPAETEPDASEGLPTVATIIRAAVRRVTHALQRTRYFVALDGLETYLWPPLTHHGETFSGDPSATTRLHSLLRFFDSLVEAGSFGESKVCIGIDPPKTRMHDDGMPTRSAQLRELAAYIGRIQSRNNTRYIVLAPAGESFSFEDTFIPKSEEQFTAFTPKPDDEVTGPVDQEVDIPILRLGTEFLEYLRTTVRFPGLDHKELWPVILLYLSACRRTRHLTLMRHLLDPFLVGRGSAQAVESFLSCLAHYEKLGFYRLEGGNFWFDRITRDYIYSHNSNYAVSRDALNACKSSQIGALQCTVPQLFLLMVVHHQIGRSYHNRLFTQSQDTFVFLEYTYHAISSIRYLVKLLAIAQAALATESQDNAPASSERSKMAIDVILDALRRSGKVLRSAVGEDLDDRAMAESTPQYDRILRRMGLTTEGAHASEYVEDHRPGLWELLHRRTVINKGGKDKETRTDVIALLRSIVRELKARHIRELSGLHRSWLRAEQVLRTQVSAQQLLHWCHCLLEDEMPQRINNVVLRYEDESGLRKAVLWTTKQAGINKDVGAVCSSFAESLRDLRVKLWIERSEYLECVKARHAELSKEGLLKPAPADRDAFADAWKASLYLPNPENIASVRCKHLHWMLDIAVCFLKHFQTRHRPTHQQPRPCHREIEIILDWVEERLKSLGKRNASSESAHGEREEATIRLADLRTKVDLETVSFFSTGFDGYVPVADRDELATRAADALKRTNLVLNSIHAEDRGMGAGARNTVVEPGSDGSLYGPYRSIFHLVRGRALCQLFISRQVDRRDTPGPVLDGFTPVFRSIEMARGGLGGENALLAAINEIYGVEACLVWSRLVLHCPEGCMPGDSERRLEQAAAKHELARFALQRAERYLDDSHRNVIWWRLFYLMVGQYHSERLLLGFARLADAFPKLYLADRNAFRSWIAKDVAPFLTRLRKGYNALRDALDYQLPRHGVLQSAWLLRIWCEMTLASFGIGCLLVRLAQRHEGIGPGTNHFNDSLYVWKYIVWVNQREFLATEDSQVAERSIDILAAESNDTFDFALQLWKPPVDANGKCHTVKNAIYLKQSALVEIGEIIRKYCEGDVNSQSYLSLRQTLIERAAAAVFVSIWRYDERISVIESGLLLRIELDRPAVVRWSCHTNEKCDWSDLFTHDAGDDIHAADLPTSNLKDGDIIRFTFRWRKPGSDEWEHPWGDYFIVKVGPTL